MTTGPLGKAVRSLSHYRDRYGPRAGMFAFYAPALVFSAAALAFNCVLMSLIAVLSTPQIVAHGGAGDSLDLHDIGSGGYLLWVDMVNFERDEDSLQCKASAPNGHARTYDSGPVLFSRDVGEDGWTVASSMKDPQEGEVMVCTGEGLRGVRVIRDDWVWAFPVAVGNGLLGTVVLPVSLVSMRMRRRARA